ncbi:MAG TPA: asparagine synthase (glutamine-hydrolyzing), partial [Bacteroidetes bacterium]|nr:asparagine synthase (glutamine-hydrolyzing) [Bacteroidota bacterium]
MCGICGVSFRNEKVSEILIKTMCDKITHRGPDEAGYFAHGNFGMGMRRLSIIDLSTGSQPIFNENHSMAIVFNGEIYNFQSIREDLRLKGHKFYTNTDTEAIIHAYEEYGEKSPEKLNGMFAYSIFNKKRKSVFLARDRVGIKPLYYYWDGKTFAFGSEIKTILEVPGIDRTIDMEALNHFLTFEYISSPESIFKKIRKLPPGHWLLFENGQITTHQYWQIPFTEDFKTEDEAKEELRALLSDSVHLRLISDVPLGAFLSGGIDSSTIVGLMAERMNRPVKSFSIGFEDSSYNELEYARMVAAAFKTEHKEFVIRPDAVSMVEKLIYHLDEPFGDFSIFPTYLVSKMARDYVTVILSGDGGDELFGGYDTYLADKMARAYRQIPGFVRKGLVEPFARALPPTSKKKGLINKIKRFTEGAAYPDDLQHVRWMIFLSETDRAALFRPDHLENFRDGSTFGFMHRHFKNAKTEDRLNQQSFVDINTYLVDDI